MLSETKDHHELESAANFDYRPRQDYASLQTVIFTSSVRLLVGQLAEMASSQYAPAYIKCNSSLSKLQKSGASIHYWVKFQRQLGINFAPNFFQYDLKSQDSF